ncbi:MAG: hypothetical protein LBI04_04185, partial [Treponema sp.]|nr:hypothetical protein [Treponema sp.]
DELELLTNYWQKDAPNISFLLFSDFVGITEAHEGKMLREKEKQLFEQLGVYDDEFKAAIYPNETREQQLKEDNYQWEQDSELGWIFTSPDYPCYSLRNKAHIGSDCGAFPFEEWSKMMNEVKMYA